MKKNLMLGITILLLVLIIISGYTYYLKWKKSPLREEYYRITSLRDFDPNLCGSIDHEYEEDGFNSGLRLVLKDKFSGELLGGYATTLTKDSQSSLSLDETYSCKAEINSEEVIVSAYARGYSPLVFDFKYPKNKLATVEVSMIKSCSGGPSCFDNIKPFGKIIEDHALTTEEVTKDIEDRFFDIIKQEFGLEKTDYELQCMECDMDRGGYIKAKGNYKDGSPIELYYHWGWCSSGGTDCGWRMCFTSTSDNLFKSVKNSFCGRISSRGLHDEYGCTSEAYDTTEEVKSKCWAGEFERIDEDKKTLAITQNLGRCTSSIEKSNFDCLGN